MGRDATKATVAMCEDMLKVVRTLDPKLDLKFNKFYIGLAKEGRPDNFVIFRPKKDFLKIEPRLDRTDELDKLVEDAGLDTLAYDDRWGRYRFRVKPETLKKGTEVITDLIRRAFDGAGK